VNGRGRERERLRGAETRREESVRGKCMRPGDYGDYIGVIIFSSKWKL